MKECPICLKEFNKNDLCLTSCNHEYCNDCLNIWFNTNRTDCPICRKSIKSFIYNNEKTKIIHISENINNENIDNQINEINNIFNTLGDIISLRKLNLKLKYILIFSGFFNISFITTSIYLYLDK
tara:strand:+ start:1480 stop:1854 length:375 start_codon:yes stop_codon:yes gene_type:complete